MNDNRVTVRVWGDFACFTRPEMKVERVSYPVMTPSAARGILEAIFWEPQIYYLIDASALSNAGAGFRSAVTKSATLSVWTVPRRG
jgi:CRISPR-associated protein Cas5d